MAQTAVIVGAGPAGTTTAAALARRGWNVAVFERRPEFSNTAPSTRSYPMSLGPRSVLTILNTAGLDGVDSVGPRSLPQEGLYFNRKPLVMRTGDPKHENYVVDRQTLGYELHRMAAAQQYPQGGSITWHFQHSLASVDFTARQAVFVADPDGSGKAVQVTAQYDLLVGADGAGSAVRSLLTAAVPGIATDTPLTRTATYKTFHHLPIDTQVLAAMPGLDAHNSRQFIYLFRASADLPTLAMWKAPQGTLSGMIAHAITYEAGDLSTVLGKVLKGLPRSWTQLIVAQTSQSSGQRPSPFGQIIRVSQFHGPSCVLLGDSAHAVTSALGQGCNMALESVRVFIDTLDEVGLEAAPAAFTARRVKDAHAFQTLEFNQLTFIHQPEIIHGTLRVPSGLEMAGAKLLMQYGGLLYMLGHLLMPRRFPHFTLLTGLLRDAGTPYSRVLWAMRLQAGLLVSLAAAVVTGIVSAVLPLLGLASVVAS